MTTDWDLDDDDYTPDHWIIVNAYIDRELERINAIRQIRDDALSANRARDNYEARYNARNKALNALLNEIMSEGMRKASPWSERFIAAIAKASEIARYK